jgi:nitrogen regulatory protein P-II 1
MIHLLIIILDDLSSLPKLLQAWHDIGVPGATILESVGAHRARGWLSRVGLEGLEHLFEAKEVRRRTLLAALDNEALLAQAVAEAERVVGGFDRPNSGVLLVVPVTISKGLFKPTRQELKKTPAAMRPGWESLRATPVEQANIILDLEPTIVTPDTTLDEVAQAMLIHPNVHVASVVAEDGRLVGLIKLRTLSDDLFFHILPEEFLTEVTDLEHVMTFANKSHALTAADAMEPAVWVKLGDTIKDAFKRMHEHDLPGLPVVDDLYRVVGYINLLELLAVCSRRRQEIQNTENSHE